MPSLITPSRSILDSLALPGEGHDISHADFRAVCRLIYQEAGISLSDAKRALVCSRLAKRLRHLGLHTHKEYLDYLATQDPKGTERQIMVNCLTTNKTDFFREPHHFTFLREVVFPQIQRAAAQGRPRRLRIWSAGCSSGEEPYTIAMTVLEHFGSLYGWQVEILASDINTEVLRKAQEAIYDVERIEGVEERIKRKYFLRGTGPRQGTCQVRPEVRRLINFRQINFMEEPWPVRGRFDVIFCRNVIIYFDLETQQRLLPRLAGNLTEDGYLMLGHSENVHWMSELLTPLGGTVYKTKHALRRSRGVQPQTSGDVDLNVPPPRPHAESLAKPSPRKRQGRVTKTGRQEIIAGEFFSSREPTEISTVLGSCVAACLFDPVSQIGGMNHFMLPFHTSDTAVSARYGIHAMELLINEMMKLGGDRRRFQAKVFGGANVLRMPNTHLNVGVRNAQFVRNFLETENIPIVAQRLGGELPMRVHLISHTGQAFVKLIESREQILEREAKFVQQIDQRIAHPSSDNVTLF